MLKSLLTKSKALFSVGAIAVIATIAIAAVVLVNGHDQDGSWGSLWGKRRMSPSRSFRLRLSRN